MVRKLLYLNGLAILGVVLFHSAGTGFIAMFSWSHRYLAEGVSAASQIGSLSYYVLRLFEQIAVFSLPAFIFVSGYFVSIQAGRTGNIQWTSIRARIKSLLIPYLFWTLVIIFLGLLESKRYGAGQLIEMLLTGSANPVLYFVPLIIQFYLLAPLFVSAARKNWKVLLVISLLLQILVITSQYPRFLGADPSWSLPLMNLVPKWLFLARIMWFPLGIIIGFHSEAVGKFLTRYWLWLLAGAALLIPLGMIEWEIFFRMSGEAWLPHRETYIDTIYTLLMIFGVLGVQMKRLPFQAPTSTVGAKSYGIYLTHAIFIEYTARIIYVMAPALLAYQIILQPIFILVGLGGPLLMMSIWDKIPISRVRSSYAYIFG
ncbi:MAG: acyltransferase family protein [Anaerolineales bacterium]